MGVETDMARRMWVSLLVLVMTASAAVAEPSVVSLEKSAQGSVRLLHNGKPYFIRGGAGSDYLELLVASGGNSIRTWSADGIGALLDDAHKRGITVTIGFWLGQPRQGFKYSDAAAVARQFEKCKAAVRRYKDHPALLMWAIGNEMEGDGKTIAIWKAVERIAAMCKKEDPNHPTMTVIAELGEGSIKSKMVHQYCPSIDVLGINSYGGLMTLATRYRKAGGAKPYVVTEYGPAGHWEVDKTAWGAPREENSTTKAKRYRDSYLASIKDQPLCLGGYAFNWGHKMEVTETWFSMILRGGLKTKAVDVMTELWTGKPPANRCPDIGDVTLDRDSGLKPGDKIRATLKTASDPDKDQVTVIWRLLRDSGQIPQGGDFQEDEPAYPGAIVSSDTGHAIIRIPESGGGYRVYAYVLDGQGATATANAPLKVEGKVLPVKLAPVKLPFVVYGDAGGPAPYASSGYMGNHGVISMDASCKEEPFKGDTCLKVTYNAPDKWGGVVWQSPANDWGKKPGGYNLTGAKALEFVARGHDGGETVGFLVGVIKDNQPFPDSVRVKLNNVKLTKQWTTYRIPLNGKDLSCIKSGFGWTVAGKGKATVFYLDEIRFTGD